MASPQGPRPPGWYDDPEAPGRPRWWDGYGWAPPGPPPGMPMPGMPMPGRGYAPPNLREEKTNGDRARVALWVGVGVQTTSIIANIIYFNEFAPAFRDAMQQASTRPRGTRVDPMASLSSTAVAASAVSQLAGIISFIVGILFLVWFFRALTNAQALGLPLRRSPGWGVAGFLIPIVNFWFPYQSACDLFPPGHPDRKVVGRWWACYLSAGFVVVAALFTAFASVAAAAVVGVFGVLLYVGAAVAGRDMIAKALAVHSEIAGPEAAPPPWSGPVPPGMAAPAPANDPWNPPAAKDPWAPS